MGEFLIQVVFRAIACLALLPVGLIVATPFVLISAPFRRGGIRAGYAAFIRGFYDFVSPIL